MFAHTLKSNGDSLVFYEAHIHYIYFTFAIGLVHVFYPMSFLHEAIFKNKFDSKGGKTFDEARINFITDYDIENPATSKIGKKELKLAIQNWKKQNKSPKIKFNSTINDSVIPFRNTEGNIRKHTSQELNTHEDREFNLMTTQREDLFSSENKLNEIQTNTPNTALKYDYITDTLRKASTENNNHQEENGEKERNHGEPEKPDPLNFSIDIEKITHARVHDVNFDIYSDRKESAPIRELRQKKERMEKKANLLDDSNLESTIQDEITFCHDDPTVPNFGTSQNELKDNGNIFNGFDTRLFENLKGLTLEKLEIKDPELSLEPSFTDDRI